MLGRKERGQLELFITGFLRGLIHNDHVLVRVDQVLDLGWLHAEVADLPTMAAPASSPRLPCG